MKNIIINVDDLGFSPAVNKAVICLAEKKRIQATSFMSLGEIHADDVLALKYLDIEIGLHFDLTGLAQQGNLKQILWKAYLQQFSHRQLQHIIEFQLDQFEQKIGAIPDFIDGHQHVHQFPQIRQILLNCIERRYHKKIPIRNTYTYQQNLKAKMIYCLGGIGLRQELIQKKWPHNPYFAGIYSFNADFLELKALWQTWLELAPDNTVIMCHPSQKDSHWTDEIYTARQIEYEWLLSDEFLEIWHVNSCQAQSWKNF